MGVGVQALIGVNSHIKPIFLNTGLERIGEAGTIEDENQEPRNIKDILKGQGQRWSGLFYPTFLLLIGRCILCREFNCFSKTTCQNEIYLE